MFLNLPFSPSTSDLSGCYTQKRLQFLSVTVFSQFKFSSHKIHAVAADYCYRYLIGEADEGLAGFVDLSLALA